MAEVTQARETKLAIGDNRPQLGRVKRSCFGGVGAIGAKSFGKQATNQGE